MKKFVIKTALYLAPFVLAFLWFKVGVDKALMRGDIARMSQRQFVYSPPEPDTSLTRSLCSDYPIDSLPTDGNRYVVLGDSFSDHNERSWPNDSRWHQYLGGQMDRSIVSLRYRTFPEPMTACLSLLIYAPEKLSDTFFVETVERMLIVRGLDLNFDSATPLQSLIPEPPTPQPQTTKRTFHPKKLLAKLNRAAAEATEYYKKQLQIENLVLHETLDADYFSCRPNHLYFYFEDTIARSATDIAQARRNLEILDSIAKNKNKTMVIVAIPDKFTAYQPHTTRPTPYDNRLLNHPSPFDSLPFFINTLDTISPLIESGIKDVYLADDTHFSATAARAVGLFVANKLKK